MRRHLAAIAALIACASMLATAVASGAGASSARGAGAHARGHSGAQRARLARSRAHRRSRRAHRLTLRGPRPVAPHALWVGTRVALLEGVSPAALAAASAASAEAAGRRVAPVLAVRGTALTWTAVPGVSAYELATRIPGQPDRVSTVSSTSLTPAPVPGVTVTYSVRTAVEGSEWSAPATIAYPAFQSGMNAGWVYPGQLDTQAVVTLKAKVVRVNFPIEWTAAQLRPTIAGYAALGVRVAPLASFDGRIPSGAEARNLASWARAYGPEGTFWTGRSDGALAIQTIEFGNETSGGYQYGDSAGAPSYMARARAYATLIREAAQAISAAGSRVGMLAVSEDWTGDWMNEMFAAVPDLGNYVAGWVSHPYGTEWKKKIEYDHLAGQPLGAPSSTSRRRHRVGRLERQRPLPQRQLRLQPVHDLRGSRRNAALGRRGDPQAAGRTPRPVPLLSGTRPEGLGRQQ